MAQLRILTAFTALLLVGCVDNSLLESQKQEVVSMYRSGQITAKEMVKRAYELDRQNGMIRTPYDSAYWAYMQMIADKRDSKQISSQEFSVLASEARARLYDRTMADAVRRQALSPTVCTANFGMLTCF